MIEVASKGSDRKFRTHCSDCHSILYYQASDVVERTFNNEFIEGSPKYRSDSIKCPDCGKIIEVVMI